jgi:hypothetical protein
MDRRRFFINKPLKEGLSTSQKASLLEDTFAELDRLYEADEAATEQAATETDEQKPSEASNEVKTAEAIVDKLQDSNYEQFVKILDSDGKSKAFLKYLRQHYKIGDDSLGAVKAANPQVGMISCSKLIPTQENISLSKSLGMVSKPGWSEKIINTPTEAFDTPTVTYAAKYIIDGHHRWSKAYALNGGNSKIKVLNFPAIEGVTWEDMLKAVQLAIVAMVPSAKLVNEVGNDNMLADDGSASKKFYVDNACDQVVEAMKKKGRGDTKEAQGDFVSKNVAQMKQTSTPISGAKPRAFMPQMDDEGKTKAKIIANGIIDISAK